ncbi:Ig-like domain-containing protein, partial [Myxococcota bacterium]|nr:Ig-like domain-containing protein [Myxococcota bacterium]MBU1534746.1 Ig-like domain-containing protein [Myxococcota bacterium]
MRKKIHVTLSLIVATALLSFMACQPKTTDPTRLPVTSAKGATTIDPFTGLAIMVENAQDRKFSLYQGPPPPKRVTEKMSEFPVAAKGDMERRDYGPLEVLRAHPLGKVQNMGALTVSFNQPMIPLTDLEQEKNQKIPLSIDPRPQGAFKWLGTTVVSFEPDRRFPFATRYVVKIPQGTTSAVGGVLKESRQFSFETPRVALASSHPYSTQSHVIPEAAIVLIFNQRIDPTHIAANTSVLAGLTQIPFTLVPRSKWKDVKPWGKQHKKWDARRTVVLQPRAELPKATGFTVRLKKGIRSEEGPLETLADQSLTFQTYGPLKVNGVGCGWKLGPCLPGHSPRIQFSNRLALDEKEMKKRIAIRPAVKNLEIRGYGESVYLNGEFLPAKTYTVLVKRDVKDIYEQTLPAKWQGKLKILDATPEMHLPAYKFGVLESKEGKALEVETINNLKEAVITLVEVQPEHMLSTIGLMRDYYWSSGSYSYVGKRYARFKVPTPKQLAKAPGIPGPADYVPGQRMTYAKKFNQRKNVQEKSRINLNKILKGKGGTVFVQIYSPDLHTSRYTNPYRWVLIQVTNLGITARYDNDRIVTMVTELSSGKPVGNASVALYKRKNSKDYYNVDTEHIWKGTTNAQGMVEAPGVRNKGPRGPYVLVVENKK